MGACVLYIDDLIDSFQTDVVMSSSATDPGYNRENVRDGGFGTAWKGVDSTTADVWMQIDKGNTTWLGGLGAQAFVAIAYDARNNEQDNIEIITDDLDNPAMTATTVSATFTLVKNGLRPAVAVAAISNPARRYWRFNMRGNARSEAAGSKVPRIYRWSFFRPTGIIDIDGAYFANTPGPGQIGMVSKVGSMRTGSWFTCKSGSTDQDFELRFIPANEELWTVLRDKLFGIDNNHRTFYITFDGLRSDGTSNFALVRLESERWDARRPYVGLYETEIKIVTCPW